MAPLSLRALAFLGLAGAATAVTLSVSNTGGNATNPYMYGIMFEDISHSGDGGLYAELIQNRAFQDGTLSFWGAVGGASIALDTSTPLSQALPHSVKVSGGSGTVGIQNGGYWGFDVKKSNTYTGSFYSYGAYSGRFTASLVSNATNKALATTTIKSKSVAGKWTQHTFELRPTQDAPDVSNTFVLQYSAAQGTELKFNLISLFPPTYNNRPNGMRPELMEKLKALNPSYIRAPGGNNIEGNVAGNYWNWSATVGPLTDRPGREGTWSYYNTDGLGLVEYMHWAEDLDMEVVLAVPSGLALDGAIVPQADLDSLVQDALNELEFLMGDVSTPYGALRAKLGYPKPWNIKFVEVGNEDHLNNGLSSYESYRLQMFYDAIHAKYPDIFIFSSTAEFMYKQSGRDYHEYTRPDFFVSQFGMFDSWSAGNNIMIGEYASIQNNTGKLEDTDWSAPKIDYSTWIGSVSEAVFLLGAERNADRIWGASFAPLLQNLNDYQWTPDLISFTADPADTTVSTSYPVIELLSGTRISHTLPAKTVAGEFGPAYWVAGRDDSQYILKAAVYNSTGDVPFSVGFDGLRPGASAQLTVLTAPGGPFAQNTPEHKNSVASQTQHLTAGKDGSITFSLPNLSVAVLTAKF